MMPAVMRAVMPAPGPVQSAMASLRRGWTGKPMSPNTGRSPRPADIADPMTPPIITTHATVDTLFDLNACDTALAALDAAIAVEHERIDLISKAKDPD